MLLPHFFTASLADPNYEHVQAPDLPNNMRADLERVVEMAAGYWLHKKPLIPHDSSSFRRVVACYTIDNKTKEIKG